MERGESSFVGLALVVLAAMLLGWMLEHTEKAHGAPVATCQRFGSQDARTRCIIRSVFAEDPNGAVRVAWCESRLDVAARNGEYRGLFQMGAAERARFGHGRSALAQARAARRYFEHAGGWRPWSCQP